MAQIDSNARGPGSIPPPKPWEQAGASSGSAPFKPPSSGSTSDVVEASGTPNPGEIVSAAGRNTSINRNTLGRPVPSRPWEQNYGNNHGGYGSMSYNTGLYNSYGGFGGTYGGGLYGNSMYNNRFGGLYGGSGVFGGGLYNNEFGGPMGAYGMGMTGPYGNQDPNNPYGSPSPPGFWMSFIRVMHGVVNFFGRISILVDQNTQAFHMFMSALLQIFDRSSLLYGELAKFVLRLLGIRTKPRRHHQLGSSDTSGPPATHGQNLVEGTKDASILWDNVWGDGSKGIGK